MNERDLVEIISEGRMMSETCEIFGDILEKIEENPKEFVSNIREILTEMSREFDICPECGLPLEPVRTCYEDRGEYWGTPTYETVNIYGCTECNYIEE